MQNPTNQFIVFYGDKDSSRGRRDTHSPPALPAQRQRRMPWLGLLAVWFSYAVQCQRLHAAAHAAHGRLDLLLPGGVGLKHVLDKRLADGQQPRELALNLRRTASRQRAARPPWQLATHTCLKGGHAMLVGYQHRRAGNAGPGMGEERLVLQAQLPAASCVLSILPGAGESVRGGRARARAVSSRLLERGATMTLACSSSEKLDQVISGSTYCLYSSRISLWLIAPGLV